MLTLWVAHNTAESSSSMLHETDRERYGSDCTPVNGVTWYLARYNGCHPRTASLQTVFLIATIFDRVSPRIAIRVTKLIPADDFSCTGRVRPRQNERNHHCFWQLCTDEVVQTLVFLFPSKRTQFENCEIIPYKKYRSIRRDECIYEKY